MAVPRLVTVGVIAEELGERLHRVEHLLRTRPHLAPAARAGSLRLYRRSVIAVVAEELRAIDAARTHAGGKGRSVGLRVIGGSR